MAFELPKLNYALDSLEPYIDKQTMEIHYGKHHQAYVDNLNKAIKDTAAENQSLEIILSEISKFSPAIRNNGGGHYNHELFWSILTNEKDTKISATFEEAVLHTFGSLELLKEQMNNAGLARFGSGWIWLIKSGNGLKIVTTANQDNPLMDVSEEKGYPIIGIDVWEHAYYLKYQNKRAEYLQTIWNVINWEEISKRFDS